MQNKLYIEIAGLISNISILKDYMNVYKKTKSIKRDNLVQFYRLGYEYAKAHK